MKLLIASDLHGSAYYTQKMADLFASESPDRLVLLGDLLYHGPRNPLPREYDPPRVAGILNSLKEKLLCVRGNCDSEVDQMVLEFPIGAEYAFWYDLGSMFFLTHGHIINEENPPSIGRKDVLLHGHTHVPAAVDLGTRFFINPGSVSLPKNGSPNSCALYEDGVFRLVDLDGNELGRLDIRQAAGL